MEAISSLPPERSLSSLSVVVRSPEDVRAVLSLADSTATHALQTIKVSVSVYAFEGEEETELGLFREDAEISLFRLLTIPTLRSLALVTSCWLFLSATHVDILSDCVRTRARSGAPPLRTLAFEKVSSWNVENIIEQSGEDVERIIEDIESLMKVESPSTSVVVGDYREIDSLLFG